MASDPARNQSMQMRKAKSRARVKALQNPSRYPVIPLVTAVDPDCVRRPLIFYNVQIPEADLDAELEDV